MGAVIRIGNSSYSTCYLDSGIFVSPSFDTYIAMNREFKSTLPQPYSNCEIDSNSPDFISNLELYNLISQSEYAYTQQLCFFQFTQKYVINKYNCVFGGLISLYTATECDTSINELIKQSNMFLNSSFYNDICIPLCPLECNQTLYKTSISLTQLKSTS